MSKTPIEQTIVPSTVNEVLLLNRIDELHRQRLLGRHNFDFGIDSPPGDYDFKLTPDHHTLYMAADAYADFDWPKQVTITTKSHNKKGIGYRQFVTYEMLNEMNTASAANILGELHKKLIRSLAKFIEEEKTD